MSLAKAIGKREGFTSPSVEAYLLLLRISDLFQRQMNEVLKAESLSSPQYNVLRILRGHGRPCTCSEIGDQLVVQDPDVTRLIDRLEKRSPALLERTRCTEDRRVVWVQLTQAGLAALERLDGPIQQQHEANFSPLAQPDLQNLVGLLTALLKA
jgi:DNA-binding MarR family transcriptional regulator